MSEGPEGLSEGPEGLSEGPLGLPGESQGLSEGLEDGCIDIWMEGQNFSIFYKIFSPLGASAQKPSLL